MLHFPSGFMSRAHDLDELWACGEEAGEDISADQYLKDAAMPPLGDVEMAWCARVTVLRVCYCG